MDHRGRDERTSGVRRTSSGGPGEKKENVLRQRQNISAECQPSQQHPWKGGRKRVKPYGNRTWLQESVCSWKAFRVFPLYLWYPAAAFRVECEFGCEFHWPGLGPSVLSNWGLSLRLWRLLIYYFSEYSFLHFWCSPSQWPGQWLLRFCALFCDWFWTFSIVSIVSCHVNTGNLIQVLGRAAGALNRWTIISAMHLF